MTQDNLLKWSAFVFLFLGVSIAVFNIWQPYSYWWDELYSVTTSTLPMNEMFSKVIMYDVHPPLYQIVLNYWIDLFGESEVATRSLSLLFALLAISIFAYWAFKYLPLSLSAVAIMVFSTNLLFSFYAQETRPYAMMLFLSTLLTIKTLIFINSDRTEKTALVLSFIALLLSLTHFFGFLFAGLILLYLFLLVKPIKQKVIFFFAGFFILIWPITHFLVGSLASKTGGNFWLKSDGVHTTLKTFANALAPQLTDLFKLLPAYFIAIVGFIVLAGFTIYVYRRLNISGSSTDEYINNIFKFVALISFLFLAIVASIDLHTPITTTRNLAVLLPVFSVFLSYLFLAFYGRKKIHFFLVILFSLSGISYSFLKLNEKQYPLQNHLEASQFIVEKKLIDTHKFYYHQHPTYSHLADVVNLMATFYLKKLTDIDFEAVPLEPDNLADLDKNEPFIFFNQHFKVDTDSLITELKSSGFDVDYYEPSQKQTGKVFIIYAK